jgi:hypothetical protein
MTPDRWKQVSQSYEAARSRPATERAAFLAEPDTKCRFAAGAVLRPVGGDGQELYCRTLGNRLMAVPNRLGSGPDDVDVGTPVRLFQMQVGGDTVNQSPYAVCSKGLITLRNVNFRKSTSVL